MAFFTTYFTTFSTESRVGAITGDWNNGSNTQVEDAVGNSFTGPTTTGTYIGFTNYFKCSDLFDSVPSGSTIDGLYLRIKRRAYKSPLNTKFTVKDESIFYEYLGSQGANKADTVTAWPNLLSTYEFATYGSQTDKWGLSLTDTVINSTSFSLYVATTNDSDAASPSLNSVGIDYIETTVYYTPPGGGDITPTRSRVFLIT